MKNEIDLTNFDTMSYDLLDNNEVERKFKINGLATEMDRFRNLFLDSLLILLLFLIVYFNITIPMFNEGEEKKLGLVLITLGIVYFSYYLTLESLFALTIGKFFNKVRVITIHRERPTFGQVLLRSVIRLIPFSFVTFYTPHNRTLHDLLSKTWVVRIKKIK